MVGEGSTVGERCDQQVSQKRPEERPGSIVAAECKESVVFFKGLGGR